MDEPLWPMAVFMGVAVAVAATMLGLSSLLGERSLRRFTAEPYESGVVPAGPTRVRFQASYFRIALLFALFDLEIVFLVAWALVVRDAGWSGFFGILVFALLLLLALAYLARAGALDWFPRRRAR